VAARPAPRPAPATSTLEMAAIARRARCIGASLPQNRRIG
jgi:hypothetical protein